MKHDALIAPDESQFAFTPKISGFAANDGSTDTITVPDAELLFQGTFKRDGDDLKIIGKDGNAFLVDDYFKGEKKPTLLSPEGASLSSAVIESLAGPLAAGQYAQAGAPQGTGQAIGRVEKAEGSVSVVRNGVTITLNAGDVVMKGDVVQTGAGGSLGIVFSDGTAFNLSANARMILNDFVYNAGGGNNSALISLVQGSISFVAGQVAKTGDMKIETPVATMGIRGTAVLVEIEANNGQTKFSVMVEPDGTTGSFNLYDKSSGALLATVNSSNIGWVVTPVGPLQVLAQQVQKSPAELARELAIVQQVFQTFNTGPFDPNAPQQQPQQDPGRRGDNPQGTQTAGSSSGGTQIDTIKVTVTQVGGGSTPGNNTTPGNPTNTGDPTDPGGTGTGDGTPTIVEQTITPPALNPITGSGFIFGTAGADQITGSNDVDTIDAMAGNDFVFAFGGNDVIIAGHGEGDDYYDGGTNSEEGDTIRFASTTLGVIIDLDVVNGVLTATADSEETGHDIIVNIENFVGGSGNDIFVLHTDTHWELDGGGGFDTVQLVDGLDITGNDDGPTVYNIEMVDLDDGEVNVVDFDGDGVEDFNDAGVIRVIGNTGDIVNLDGDQYYQNIDGDHYDQGGHWVRVSGPQTDTAGNDGLFSGDDHTNGVTFQRYDFVDDYGYLLSTAYIDVDITTKITDNESPVITVFREAIVVEDEPENSTAEASVSVSDPDSDVRYVLNESWTPVLPGLAGVQEFNGHYYAFVPLEFDETWTTAQGMAWERGGYLATITSGEENAFVLGLIDPYTTPGVDAAFIGGSDSSSEGLWYWSSGLEGIPYFFDTETGAGSYGQYKNWRTGEPNDDLSIEIDEDFLAMEGDGTWNDVADNHAYAVGYVIEFSSYQMEGKYGYAILNTANGTITYHLNNDDPDTQALGQGEQAFDSFQISVNDGDSTVTEPVYFAIEGANDAPVVDSHDAEVDYTVGDPGVAVNSDITLSDIDSDTLNGAKITISDFEVGDTLIFADAGNITGSFDPETGVLTLTGDDTIGSYQLALRSVSYQNNDVEAAAGDRTITFEVDDGAESNHASDVATSTIHVDDGGGEEIPNQAPVINIDNVVTTDDPDSTTVLGLVVSDEGKTQGEEQYTVIASAQFGTLSMSEGNPESAIEFHASLTGVNNMFVQGITYIDPIVPEPGTATVNEKVTLTVTDPQGGSDTINFIFNLLSDGESAITLSGTEGKDILFSTGYDDTLTGDPQTRPGLGSADVFVFSFDEFQIGNDKIEDFDIGEDRIVFDGGFYAEFDDIKNQITDDGNGNALINLGEDGTIVLTGVAPETLQASNFVFNPYIQ